MTDIDRLLGDSLRAVGHAFRPADLYGAQAEFLHRRRRRRTYRVSAAIALAGLGAAAAWVTVATQPFAEDGQAPVAQGHEMVVAARVDVGAEPSGLVVAAGSVWTANSGDGTVSRVDPSSTQVIEEYNVGGEPDDVAVAAAAEELWVANPDSGGVQRVDLTVDVKPTPEVVGYFRDEGHIDIAVDDDGVVWAVASTATGLVRVDTNAQVMVPGEWSDVAVEDGIVWLLEERTSSVSRYDPVTRDTALVAVLSQADTDDDLAVGEGYVWVANGDSGTVLRVDPDTGEVSDRLVVGGRYAAVTIGEGAVWVLAVNLDGVGTLFEIDPETIGILSRLKLKGDPADVALGDGSLWVTNNDTDTLTRIDLIAR